jgi:hypothetical protein
MKIELFLKGNHTYKNTSFDNDENLYMPVNEGNDDLHTLYWISKQESIYRKVYYWFFCLFFNFFL